jgi:hypothetical protein
MTRPELVERAKKLKADLAEFAGLLGAGGWDHEVITRRKPESGEWVISDKKFEVVEANLFFFEKNTLATTEIGFFFDG